MTWVQVVQVVLVLAGLDFSAAFSDSQRQNIDLSFSIPKHSPRPRHSTALSNAPTNAIQMVMAMIVVELLLPSQLQIHTGSLSALHSHCFAIH